MPHKNPRTLTFRGKTKTIPAWAKETGIPESTIRSRLDRLGMSVEEALSRPSNTRFRPTPKPQTASVRPAPRMVKDERGRGIVRWRSDGVRHKRVFGPWGQKQTVQAYSRWCAEWYANQGSVPTPEESVSVARLILACMDWAEAYFVKGGRRTSEVAGFRSALATVNELYGSTEAAAFGPLQLAAVQHQWVKQGLALKTCNDYLHKVVRCWSFGVSRQMVPASVADALKHVPLLKRGRSAAPIPEPVGPAGDADVTKILPHLHSDPDRCRVLAGMILIQRATGMRPGEVCELRPENIDRSSTPWLYRPPSGGKTFHLEHSRKVWIGPTGRSILQFWLDQAEAGQPLFRLRKRRGEGFVAVSVNYYRDCIASACRLAGVQVIRPNQIRHAYATEIHRRYEDDAAVAAALGNSPEVARQVYVDGPADAVARRIAEELG